jgi:hypothetical protein
MVIVESLVLLLRASSSPCKVKDSCFYSKLVVPEAFRGVRRLDGMTDVASRSLVESMLASHEMSMTYFELTPRSKHRYLKPHMLLRSQKDHCFIPHVGLM